MDRTLCLQRTDVDAWLCGEFCIDFYFLPTNVLTVNASRVLQKIRTVLASAKRYAQLCINTTARIFRR